MARIRELISLSERWMFPKRAAANGCSYVTDLAKYKGQIKDKVLYAESLV
jgi:hypothetical protein